MSNICYVSIEKMWHGQNFDFIGSKCSPPGLLLGSSSRYNLILKLLVAT